MAKEKTQNQGKELLSWEVKDSHEHVRGPLWYAAAFIIAVGFLIYAVSTRNFLFAFIVIMFGVILVTHGLRPAGRYKFAIYELGVSLGERQYPWKDLKQFWLAYEPPEIKTLYLDFGGLRPRLPVPLEDTDPNQVRKTLVAALPEDASRTEEPMTDWLARVLKI